MLHKEILFISSSDVLQNYAYLYLNKSEEDCHIDFAETVSQAIEYLQTNQEYGFIYLGHTINMDQSLKELSSALLPFINNKKTHILGTNKALKAKDWAEYYHAYTAPDKVMLSLYDKLGLGEANSQYLSFSLLSILNLEKYPFDFYTKNNQGEFSKIFKIGEDVLFAAVNEYIDKKIQFIYAIRSDIEHGIKHIQSELENETQAELSKSPTEIYENSLEFVGQDLEALGMNISEDNKKFTKESFGYTKELVEKTIKKKSYLEDLLSKNNTFYYKHTAMTSFVCCYILDELYMSDATYKQKLCMAANLHNLFLSEEDELIVDSNEQVARFNKERQKVILEHAKICSDFFEANDKVDSDILKIIREHHGDKSGKTFAAKISSTTKLSLIFQISSLFSQKYLVESKRRNYQQVEVMNLFLKVQERLDTRDKSLLKALREVALNLN